MVNKRGYSLGPEFPIHYENRGTRDDTWAVFDARDDRVIVTDLKEWEAADRAYKENGSPPVDIAAIDSTP